MKVKLNVEQKKLEHLRVPKSNKVSTIKSVWRDLSATLLHQSLTTNQNEESGKIIDFLPLEIKLFESSKSSTRTCKFFNQNPTAQKLSKKKSFLNFCMKIEKCSSTLFKFFKDCENLRIVSIYAIKLQEFFPAFGKVTLRHFSMHKNLSLASKDVPSFKDILLIFH